MTAVASDRESAPATSTERATQPKAIETLNELWVKVGCRSNWMTPTKTERMRRTRDAQQRAIDRHRTAPVATAPANAVHVDNDGLTRVRDEHAHDLAAWAD